jgi:hypothetical protein
MQFATRRSPMKRLLTIVVAGFLALPVLAQEKPGDRGETADARRLKGRSAAPKSAEIDSAVTLDAMLKKGEKDLDPNKAATIEGYLVAEEKEADDQDIHLVLASAKGETDTRKWVIAEVTPAWQKKSPSLALAAIRKLHGRKVRVTGWLYWEPDPDQPDPRGTRWEIHPVTGLAEAGP